MEAEVWGHLIRAGSSIVSDAVKWAITRPTSAKPKTELKEPAPSEKVSRLVPAPDSSPRQPSETDPSSTEAVAKTIQPKILGPALPTSAETTDVLKRRLAKELYKAELDLGSGMRIAGKPCDCLDHKHGLFLEAASEELVTQDPGDRVYRDIIQWLSDNHSKLTIEAIASDRYKEEYPHMALQFKEWRKHIMGSSAGETAEPLTLDQAKKLAADEASREVERRWTSQKTPSKA